MKVVAILENSIISGGGFNQAVNAILQMQRICNGRFKFEVFTTIQENSVYLEKMGVDSTRFSFSLVDKLLAKFGCSSLWHTIQRRIRILGSFEKQLVKHGCDLVYFLTPSGYVATLQRLNYIVTIWDTCHRDTPEFPEVRDFYEFFTRDKNSKNNLSPALVVLVDSERSAELISFRYSVDRARLLPMPFTPSPFLALENNKSKEDVLKKYGLSAGYYFYPAQFWAHKNHIRILEALLLLNKSGLVHRVVFSGGDQGNRSYIERFVYENNLESQVHFLGFVPANEMRGLFEGCQAVLMPTYFGPTNIPPLEAWMLEKPLIYSAQFVEQVKEAAVLVDPDEASQLASAITSCMDTDYCVKLVKAGKIRLDELNQELNVAEKALLIILSRFEKRLRCWTNK